MSSVQGSQSDLKFGRSQVVISLQSVKIGLTVLPFYMYCINMHLGCIKMICIRCKLYLWNFIIPLFFSTCWSQFSFMQKCATKYMSVALKGKLPCHILIAENNLLYSDQTR
jgi:hypothetical protein